MKSSSAPNVYKNLNQNINHCKFDLSKESDVETNPGPPIDYSQDNVLLFGSNAGTQSVAMSLTSLIHNNRNGITSSTGFVNIMNTGNELYTALSRLSRQSYLLLTEVPEMITMFNSIYHPQYCPSYSGKLYVVVVPWKILITYLLALTPDGNLEIYQNNNDLNSLVQSILDIVENKFQPRDTEYYIKFLYCSSNFSTAVRLEVMAKHKSNSQKK